MTKTISASTISKTLIFLILLVPVGCTACVGQVLLATGIIANSCCTVKNNTNNTKDTSQSVSTGSASASPSPVVTPVTPKPTSTPTSTPSPAIISNNPDDSINPKPSPTPTVSPLSVNQ